VRLCERNNSADRRSVKKEGGGHASSNRAEIPLQLVVKIMVRQAVFLQPWRSTVQQISAPLWSRGMPEGGCDPVGSLRWSRLLPGPADLWREEPMLEHVCWQGL